MSEPHNATLPMPHQWTRCSHQTCNNSASPGFSECWRHADVEKMAAKIVDLSWQVGALKERDAYDDLAASWKRAWEAKDAVLQVETKRRVATEETLADIQRSVASALFGAARDDDRCPPEKITGSMIDALASSFSGLWLPEAMIREAESFLAEEDRRGK